MRTGSSSKTTQRQLFLSNEQLHSLSELLVDKIEEIYQLFGIQYSIQGTKYVSCCPVHGGDNSSACNLYYMGDSHRGNWKCRTHGCERIFQPSIIGFIRGILSHRNGWRCKNDDMALFQDTIKYCMEIAGVNSVSDMKEDLVSSEKRRFESNMRILTQKRSHASIITREYVRKNLMIPPQYYIDRGYSKEVLDSYDVGLCYDKSKPMYGKIVVPIYDDEYVHMVGCTARTTSVLCESCNCYHPDGKHITNPDDRIRWPKWKNSFKFRAEDYLYNFWRAKQAILASGIAILVEGPGDVWRLEESGVHNSLALFGNSLTDRQKSILDGSGAMSLVVLTDNDEGGKKGAESITEKCSKQYRIYFPKFTKNDIGDMSIDEITNDIKPTIDSLMGII